MNKTTKYLIFSILLLIISCNSKETKNQKEVTLNNQEMVDYFNSFNPEWQKAIRENDSDYIIGRYDDNAIIGPPNKKFIIGKKAISEHWKRIINYMDDFSYKTTEINGNPNDILLETGFAYVTYTMNNKQIKDTTKYLFAWKHIGNMQYKVLSEMFNSIK